MTIATDGQTAGGKPISGVTHKPIPLPVCYLRRGDTGVEFYDKWKPGSANQNAGTTNAYAAQGLLPDGWNSEEISTDATGHWYDAFCQFDAPQGVSNAYYLSTPSVFVKIGDPEPTAAAVDPADLARLAAESMTLPKGTLRWNPTLAGSGATVVDTDTWVWVDDAPATVTVRASIDANTWAEVVATVSSLAVNAGGFATPATCAGAGTPWSATATGDPCTIRFTHSTPGTTLNASATWDAYWDSSYDQVTHHPLAIDPLQTTATIPVAEVQSLVTGR